MNTFEEKCQELVTLSDLLHKQKLRTCFIEHFVAKLKDFNQIRTGEVKVKILQMLQLKLFEPLMLHLRTSEKSVDKCLLIEGVIEVLKLTPLDNVSVFFHLYTLVFFQVLNDKNSNLCEELKMNALECGGCLIKNSSLSVLEEVYKEESAAKFSMGVSVSVQIAKEEKSIKLRIAALEFLLAATLHHKKPTYNKGIHKKVGDLFMMYLPGTIAPLQEIILREETQHHLITIKALSCWGHILCLVLSDFPSSNNISENEMMKEWLSSYKDSNVKTIDVNKALTQKKRTKDWLEAAALTLKPLIHKIPEVRKHSNPKCRLELSLVMVKLLENCMSNLKSSLSPIIEVLVSSAVDENEEVCRVAGEALAKFETDCDQRYQGSFITVIEENLYSLINKLPRIIHSGNEKLILPSLKSFSGYLRILGRMNRLSHLISLSSTLKKLLLVIQISFELEVYLEISNQDFSVWESDLNPTTWSKPWKRFRHFADESIKTQLEDICHLLGEFGEPETIFDYLLDAYRRDYSSRKEILLILNEVILGAKPLEHHIATQLLDFYLDPENLYLALQVDDEECLNLKEARSNTIKVALVMEGIGKLATNVGKRFQDYLLKSLYYVIERMGSSYIIIREAATSSAVQISKACGLDGSITSLIQNNVDYLTFHLTVKLKRNHSGVFDVITVLMKNSPFETMPNLEEIINSVLKSSSQNLSSPHTLAYLRLFQTFVLCVNRWIKTTEDKPESQPPPEETELDKLFKFIESIKEEEMPEEDTQDNPPETEEDVIPEEPETPKPPRHISMTISVSNHCLHYLAAKDKDKKLIVLEILNEAVMILADRENDLLPLVHKIWSPLVTRFDQMSDLLLINRSFTLLCTLAKTSKYFIRHRTLKTVLPTLQSFLIKQAPKSKLKSSTSGYYFTQNFKLQRELLGNLGPLATNLELFEKQLDLVVESVLPYLSSKQPRELQERCRQLFVHLQTYDPYLVWFKLHNLTKNSEYAKNVQIVLQSDSEFR